MYIDWDTVWTTAISSLIAGLIVGGILAITGNYLWKKQNNYSKKQDALTSFLNTLYMFSSKLYNLNTFELNNDTYGYNKCVIEMYDIYYSFLRAETIFNHYFKNKYKDKISELTYIYNDSEKKVLKMTEKDFNNYITNKISYFNDIKI